MIRKALFGKNTTINGLIALMIMGFIVLGCTCNNGEFKWGSKNDSNTSRKDNDDKQDDRDDDKKADYEKADASKGEIPSDEELQEIVRADMLAFDKALKSSDFKDFYERISKFWQEQTTPRKLKKQFQGFIDGKADVSGVKNLKADFSPKPSIDDSKRVDVLEVEGSYPTKPRDSTFELKYIPEGKEWKLVGFYVKTTIYKKR